MVLIMFGNSKEITDGKETGSQLGSGCERAESKRASPTLLPHASLVHGSLPKAGNQNTVKACLLLPPARGDSDS